MEMESVNSTMSLFGVFAGASTAFFLACYIIKRGGDR